MKRALLLVDIQNDFLEGGPLAVPSANEVIPVAVRLIKEHNGFFDQVIATKDWHLANHRSFASQHPGKDVFEEILLDGTLPQILWPDHCVQNSRGSDLADELRELMPHIHKIIYKGTDLNIDSYSAFRDNSGDHETELRSYLESKEITEVYVMGLATDYCVGLTAEDSRRLGFRTYLIEDGSRGIHSLGVSRVCLELQRPNDRGQTVSLVQSLSLLVGRESLN